MLMEQESGAKVAPEKVEFVQVKPLATVGQLFNSSVICGIRVRALQLLAEKYSPETFARIKELKDGQTEEALAALLSLDPPDMNFVSALGDVAAMTNEEGLALLEERGFQFNGKGLGQAVASAYVRDRNSFRRAFARRLGDEGVGGTYYFRRSDRLTAKAKPQEISDEVIAQVQQECAAHFSRRNYGPTAMVRISESATQVGLVITHGGTRSGKAAIDRKEQRIARFDRAEKTDVVLFDSTTRLAWIMALKGDIDFYAALLGRALFGDERTFTLPVQFDLSFAKASDLQSKLKAVGGTDVQVVRMKYRQIEGLPDGDKHQKAGKNECVTEKYPALDAVTRSQGVVTNVKLGVVLTDENAAGGTIAIKEHSIGLPVTLPEGLTKQILFDLGVMRAYGS